MRSPAEIWFRLRQEAANVRLFVSPPSLPGGTKQALRLPLLPDPETFGGRLRGTAFADEIERLAESICRHRFPILAYTIETGPEIPWRRDFIHGIETDLRFFRLIPYLNPALAGDHKIIWELNRHQHLVVLAQAWQLTRRPEFLDEIPRQLESWWRQNPFARGINWTSALEVAFRALSWVWICHLAGPDLPPACADRLRSELYRHGVYLEHNLSVYFSPNTHLLGEAVALHALGALFPDWPRSSRWRSAGSRIVAAEMNKQVRDDGSHFEQSSAYHIYATDFFLFHALLEPVGQAYLDRLRRMADYLTALSSPDGMIPLLGDDDGGRLFFPYGNRRRFGAATLTSCGVFFGSDDWLSTPPDFAEQAVWLFGEKAFQPRPKHPEPARARLFPDAGVAILSPAPAHIVADTRAFGFANAGHSHAHALAIVCRSRGGDVLIDPGTYTYVGEPEWRPRFRGTSFHNTIQIDGLDQATGSGPFRWLNKPATQVLRWKCEEDWCLLDAACIFHGFRHRRILLWLPRQEILAVVDEVSYGEAGNQPPSSGGKTHTVDQFWHCGAPVTAGTSGNYRIGEESILVVPSEANVVVTEGWKSELPGQKVPLPVIVQSRKGPLPILLAALLVLKPQSDLSLAIETAGDRIRLSAGGTQWIEISLSGDPIIHWAADGADAGG